MQKTLKIGKLELATPLLLAPIAGYCDLAFRLVARSCGGVGLACTDLICPEGILRATPKSLRLAQTVEADSPLCIQLYGGNVDRLCDAARWAQDRGAHVVDINMGCPVDKVTKLDGGSKLMCDPDRTLRMVERVRAILTHTPLTAKMRLGWDDSCLNAPLLARRLEEAGVEMVTVHGRTTAMRFTGQARLEGIAEVVAAVKKIPVIGNGDIRSVADARRMFAVTRCAGIMIGRGALSMPWIFRDIYSDMTTGQIPPPPTLAEKIQLMRDHFQNVCRFESEWHAVREFRKRVSWYAKQMTPCPPLRQEMQKIESAGDFERVIAEFLEWRVSWEASAPARYRKVEEQVAEPAARQ
jgi:tRNA-dihydrouridine synthase B